MDGSSPSDSSASPRRKRGRPRLPPHSYFRWCGFCGKSYAVKTRGASWSGTLWGFCSQIHGIAYQHTEEPLKPLPITGDGATLEGADFPAYLALRLEPMTFPWSRRKLYSRWFRIENALTGVHFDVEGEVYAGLVTERFNAIEYMRGVRP